jgi:hypothetical protein
MKIAIIGEGIGDTAAARAAIFDFDAQVLDIP